VQDKVDYMNLYVFKELEQQAYYPYMEYLLELLDSPNLDDMSKKELPAIYAELFASLVAKKAISLPQAISEDLLFVDSAISSLGYLPKSLKEAALLDIGLLQSVVKRDLSAEVAKVADSELPSLDALRADTSNDFQKNFADLLLDGTPEQILEELLKHNRTHGTGLLSKYNAYRFSNGVFDAIQHPVNIPMSRFIGIDKQLSRLTDNTEAFLGNKPAQHALLYGMRGSGKSSAVRSLLPMYAEQGLRMIELAPAHLTELNTVVDSLRSRPHKYILFVDDLAFEQNDNGFQPLKTLLEGSLSSQPDHLMMISTSGIHRMKSLRCQIDLV